MALVSCPECQSQVSDRAVSCPHCGNVFTRCPECGGEVKGGDSACKNCGYPLEITPVKLAWHYDSQSPSARTQYFAPDGVGVAVVYAGFWRRFVAAIIDGFIVSVTMFLFVAMVPYMLNRAAIFYTICFGLSAVAAIAYYAVLESGSKQATIGKLALGIIVTDLRGNRISPGRAIGRCLARLVSALILLIGFLMAAFTQKKQALHDMMADTLVVVKPTSR